MKAIGDNKICSKCKVWKHVNEYYRSYGKSDGLHTYCKECFKAYLVAGDYEKGRPSAAERARQWRLDNPERWREISEKNRIKRADKQRITRAEREIRHSEKYNLMRELILSKLGIDVGEQDD